MPGQDPKEGSSHKTPRLARASGIFPALVILLLVVIITLLTFIARLLVVEEQGAIRRTVSVVATSAPGVTVLAQNTFPSTSTADGTLPVPPVSVAVTSTVAPRTDQFDMATKTSPQPTPALAVTTHVTLLSPSPIPGTVTSSSSLNGMPSLPRAMTATPHPLKLVTLTLSEALATELANHELQNSPLAVRDVQVFFERDSIVLKGQIQESILIPNTSSSFGIVIVTATPNIVDEQLESTITSITVDGTDMDLDRTLIENAMNDIFGHWLRGYRVKAYEIDNMSIRVQAYEPQ